MGLFDKLKKVFNKEEPKQQSPKEKKPPKEKKAELTAKEKASLAGEPYVNIVGLEIDPEDLHNGVVELDFNEVFVAHLVKAGYMMQKEDTDAEIVDRWWTQICRQTVLEMYEQVDADPSKRDMRHVVTRNLGGGRTEVS